METLFVTLLFSIIVSDLIISVIAHMSVHNSVTFLKKVKSKILNRNQAIIAGVQTTTTIEEIFEHTVFETKKSKVPKILSSVITEVEKSDLVSILVSEIKDKRNFIHDLIFEKENKFLFSVNSLIYVQKFIKDIYLYLGFLFSALYLIKAYTVFLNSTESVYLYGDSVMEQFSVNIILALKWFSISLLSHLLAVAKWKMANYPDQITNLLKKIEGLITSAPGQEK